MEYVIYLIIVAAIMITIFVTIAKPEGPWPSNQSSRSESEEADPPQKSNSSPEQRINELEVQIDRLRASGRKIIDQREEWSVAHYLPRLSWPRVLM
jgi:hypothetical protein